MSRFVYAFAFLLLASTVSAAHINANLTIFSEATDCGAQAAIANISTPSFILPNVTFGACNQYDIGGTFFNFTAICSARPGVLTIKFFADDDCNESAAINGATYASDASAAKCNLVANNTLGNNTPASISVPYCNPPATTSAPNGTTPAPNGTTVAPNGTTPTPTSAPTPTVPSNGTTAPPRGGVAAQQAGVSAALMAAAAAVIVMALF